jgi:hypothetical protein
MPVLEAAMARVDEIVAERSGPESEVLAPIRPDTDLGTSVVVFTASIVGHRFDAQAAEVAARGMEDLLGAGAAGRAP